MAKKLSRYIEALRLGAVIDAKSPLAGTISPAWSPVSYFEYVTFFALTASSFAASTDYPLYTFPNDGTTWQVCAVTARYSAAAGSAATFNVEVAGAAIAPGSGTLQLTSAGVVLNGTPNTTVNGVVITSPTVAGPGTMLNLIVASTATTSVANLSITVALQRLS